MTDVKTKLSHTALQELREGGEAFYLEMLGILVQTLREGLKDLEHAWRESNWKRMGERAHGMCGPCSHLGILELWQLLKSIEIRSDQNPSPNEMQDLLKRTEEEATAVLNELNHLLTAPRR